MSWCGLVLFCSFVVEYFLLFLETSFLSSSSTSLSLAKLFKSGILPYRSTYHCHYYYSAGELASPDICRGISSGSATHAYLCLALAPGIAVAASLSKADGD